MADVFISYSRKDRAFAMELHQSLVAEGRDVWVDLEDIPPTADWLKEVFAGIESAMAVVFVLSPDAVQSKVCRDELAHAVGHHKRIIPLVCRDVDPSSVPPELASLQWIPARAADDHAEAVRTLLRAIDTDLDWVRAHTRLLQRAIEWESRGHNDSLLLRGADLRDAEDWLGRAESVAEPQPTALQTRYVLTSRAAATRQQRMTLAAVSVALVVASVLAVFAVLQRNDAEANSVLAIAQTGTAVAEAQVRSTAEARALGEANARATSQTVAEEQSQIAEARRRVALSRQLATQALGHTSDQLDLALLLSAESFAAAPTIEARRGLLASLQQQPALTTFLRGHTGPVWSLAFSADGRSLVSGGDDQSLVWDVAGTHGAGVPLSYQSGDLLGVASAPDGSSRVMLRQDGSLTLLDHTTRRAVGPGVQVASDRPTAWTTSASLFAFADGANVVLGDLQTGALTGPPLSGHSAPVIALTLSRDSRVLASPDATGTVMLWDVPGRRALQPPLASGEPGQGSPVSLALSSNGQLLAWGSGTSGAQGEGEGTVQLWQTADATPLGPPLTGLRARPMLAFSPDDIALAASACREFARYGAGCTLAEVRVWDLPQRQLRGEPLLTPTSSVTSLAFGATSGTLATGGGDGTIVLWHLDATPPLATRIAEHVPVIASARGTLAIREGDLVRISDAVTGTSRGMLGDGSGGPYHWPSGGSAAISANAAWVALSACDAGGRPGCQQGEIRVWDLHDPLQPGPVLADEHGLASALAFSPDGALLATWSGARVSLWDAAGHRQLGVVPGTTSSGTGSLAFSPDNRVLAVGDGSAVKLWEVASLQSLGTLGLSNALNAAGVFESVGSLEFSPDGNRLVVGGVPINGTAGSLVLWDIASQQPLARANAAQDGGIHALAISPDGQNLISAADSGSLALWDAANLQPVGLLVPDSSNPSGASVAAAISLSADGRFVTHTGDNLLLWDLDPSAWRARACLRANRTLSESEWRQYVGDPPVASACTSG